MQPEFELSIREQPVLRFDEYGIAFHFVTNRKEPATLPSSSEEFSSFERDLLSYAYRGSPPFASLALSVPNDLRRVRIAFPHDLVYISEGLTIQLLCEGTDDRGVRHRNALVRASRTEFKSGLSVCHLVISPDHEAGQSSFNEYDFVKLAKLWEGGEGIGPDSQHAIDRLITFRGSDQKPLTFNELAGSTLGVELPNPLPRHGTIQILTHEAPIQERLEWSTVWAHIQALKSVAAGHPSPGVEDLPQDDLAFRAVKGVAGIMQGLLDFDRIEPNELSDVFGSVYLTADLFIGIHKGTLVSISAVDRAYEVAPSIGVSPYLLAPHSSLAHNEELLRVASVASEEAVTANWRILDRARREMQQSLDRHYLPNIFHYPTERMLFRLGEESRGLSDREGALRAAMADIKAELESRMTRRRRVAEDVIAGLLLILSGVSLKDIAPLIVVFPALFAAALLYVLWRLRT